MIVRKINKLKNNSGMKKSMILVFIFLLTIVIFSSSFILAFTPPANSPLAMGEHPRLHITKENLPYLRTKITTYYKSEYQKFVNWVDRNFALTRGGNFFRGDESMSQYHAFIYLVGPIEGILYPRPMEEYGNRAIDIMKGEVALGTETIGWGIEEEGIARAYDWTWPLLKEREAERTAIAEWLAVKGIQALVSGRGISASGGVAGLFSSTYFGFTTKPWYMGLSFYGEGIDIADSDCGVDSDNDGIPDSYDSDGGANDPKICIDSDSDGCDDCSKGSYNPLNDGLDTDKDGLCEKCIDTNNDRKCTSEDVCSVDNNGDGLCDVGDPVLGVKPPANDFDGDGILNNVDSDDDGDGDPDVSDCGDLDRSLSHNDKEMCTDRRDNDCDDLIDRIHDPAQVLADSFNTYMLNGGWLDAQNWVAREQGGFSEIVNYGLVHPITHLIDIDAWKSTTQQNYFAQGTALVGPFFVQYYPQFVLYLLQPTAEADSTFPDGRQWKTFSVGQTKLQGAGGLNLIAPSESLEVLHSLGEPLKTTNPEMASLLRWMLIHRAGDDLKFDWKYFLDFLFGDRSVTPKSPSELNLPLSQYFEGMGIAALRTGFENLDDTAMLISAPPYQLGGHGWFGSQRFLGFVLSKYGPLLLRLQASHTQGVQRHNLVHFYDPSVAVDGGGVMKEPSAPNDIKKYTPNSAWDLIGMLRKDFGAERDYLFMDYAPVFSPQRVKSYTRQFVYLRPSDSNNKRASDYIVIFDRTETINPSIVKSWEVYSAMTPAISEDEVVISNVGDPDRPFAHGKVFIKSLLPVSKRIVTEGGPGYRFVDEVNNNVIQPVADSFLEGKQYSFYFGTYMTKVIAQSVQNMENFLHVLQTANALNSAQSSAMVETKLIEASTGNMQGAFIEGTVASGQDNAVVMFAKEERVLNNNEPVTYSLSGTGRTRHLIADLPAGKEYEVKDNGVVVGKFTVNDDRTNHAKDRGDLASGVLSFTTNLGSEHTFRIEPTGVAVNIPPTVRASATPLSGNAPLTVQFNAIASDSDGSITSYSWDFGDESSGTGASVSHTYNNIGDYNVRVTVTDDKETTANSNVVVLVGAVQSQECGNNIREGTEQCDGNDLNRESCLTRGFDSGTLRCYSAGSANECLFDSSGCSVVQTKYQYRVKARNSAGDSEYSNTATWEEACRLTRAYWNVNDVVEGSSVSLTVEGTNCDGRIVDFSVFEKDDSSADDMMAQPTSVTFNAGRVVARWQTEWQCDGEDPLGLFCTGGNPEYYFVANVREDGSIASDGDTNGILIVTEILSTCGNQFVQPPEECDDGNSVNSDSCNACELTICGDNIIQNPNGNGIEEVCDGNSEQCFVNGYVGIKECNAQCIGFNNCIATEFCGDGRNNGNEVCDDGINNGRPNYCNIDCRGITPSVCGNNEPEAGEECDDGNENNNDACNSKCRKTSCGDNTIQNPNGFGIRESCDDGILNGQPNKCNLQCNGVTLPTCRNGEPEVGEECDDGNENNNDACTNSCRNAICGDTITRTNIEECDDGVSSSSRCTSECRLTICGDNIIQNPNGNGIGEICDRNNIACSEGGYRGTALCNQDCLGFSGCVLEERCGDRIVQSAANEQCDDGEDNGQPGKCNLQCNGIVPPQQVCGNSKIETGEQCDDSNIIPEDGCSADCNIEDGWECSGEPSRCTRRGAGAEIVIDLPREGTNLNRLLQIKYEVLFNEDLEEREFECDYIVYRKLNNELDNMLDNMLGDIVKEGEGCKVEVELREQDDSRLAEGYYVLEVDVSRIDGRLTGSATREFSVNYDRRIISRHNEFNIFIRESLEGDEVEFDSVDEDRLANSYLRFANELGEIEFREGIDLLSALNVRNLQASETREVDFDNLVEIADKKIEVKTGETGLSALNKKAHVTFNNIGFSNYEIKKDGVVCSSDVCSVVSYDTNNKKLVVEVSGFSVYEVVQKEQAPPTTQSGEPPNRRDSNDEEVVQQGCDNDGVRETRQEEECDRNDFGLAGKSNLCKDYDARYNSGSLICSRCKINVTACVIQPVLPSVNDTNVRILPSWQRILVSDISYLNISDNENVIFRLEDVEEEYLVSFSITEGRVQLEVVGESYDILIGDVFAVKLKDREVYLGISLLSEDKASLVVGLNENRVREVVIGYENRIRTVNFVLIGIVGLLIVVILALIVVLVRRKGEEKRVEFGLR